MEVVAQLIALSLIVVAGPAVIVLISARNGNL
uniref:Hypothetical chloroplast RF12 n=1 Tax=Chloroparvula japonica TaxID=1411623 RepID=A0A4D6C3C2_9CHLO|nr:hypothetical chloroplast RF12 [Chloroparvula japonica]QBX98160.1 hypothetical chloroplast RF12 [Chloroparvula japonica]